MTKTVEIAFCSLGEDCKIEFDPMWGGYECYSCNCIGWLGMNDVGQGVLYNDPNAARQSVERFENK